MAELQEPAVDIEDPAHYSIEDAKQKAEHDRMMREAEAKKQKVRREINRLRKAFTMLQYQGRQLPPHLRLPPEEFTMDPRMEQQLRKQIAEKVSYCCPLSSPPASITTTLYFQVERVHKELAWQEEKHAVALKKLKQR